MVLGELVPKMFALERAEQFALIAARPLEFFAKAFSPVLWIFNYAGRLVGKLLGLSSSLDHTSVYTEDEIRQLITLSQESGQINIEERTLINKVFEFSETTVKEAMIPRTEIVAIPENSSLDEISKAFGRSGYSRMPVYRGSLDEIAGVIHSKDLVGYLLRPDDFRIGEIVHKPNYVVDTAKLEDVLRQMQSEKFHFGFVVDEHGGVEGIITLEDLLEEIVGEIHDEFDAHVQAIEQLDERRWRVPGRTPIGDLEDELGCELGDDWDTVGGLVFNSIGHVPAAGECVTYHGFEFCAETIDGRRIVSAIVRRLARDELDGDPLQQDPGPNDGPVTP